MKRVIPAVLLIAALLTGCAVPGLSAAQANLSAQDEFFAGNAQQTEQYRPALLEPQQVCLWGRQQLEPELQTVYDQLAQAAACHDEEPVSVDADQEQVRLCLLALRTDHPEYFWFDGEGTYVTTSVPVLEDSTSVTLTYTMTEEDARAQLPQVERYVADCIASLDGAENDYQKILGVYQYIIRQTDYVLDVQDQSIISVMTQHQGTCAGYAKTFQYLMNRLNIPCTLALGTGQNGENHGWNIVQCGGDWYQVDVTWGDPVDENGAPGTSLEYTYFMLTDEEMYRDHVLDSSLPVPICAATTYNYYRQAGLQLPGWDSVSYESLLRSAAAAGERWLNVRFDRREDYDAAIQTLITQGGILTIMDNCGLTVPDSGITYSRNDTFLEFSVQLPAA